MTDVKICGLATEAAVDAALAGGARWLGFVIFPPSPRHVSPERADELAARAAGRASIVAVTVDAGDDLLADIQRHLRPHWIQLHGSESPDRALAARAYAQTGIIKALPVSDAADLEAARAYQGAAGWFLFDAKPPAGAERPGGWGEAFDWGLLKTAEFSTPFLLSGGLDAANVRAAIAASGASAVDVSSGVESAPGVKDEARIAAFLAAARDIAA